MITETKPVPVYKTTKFWALVVLTNIGLLLTSGLVLPGALAVGIGWVVTVLTVLGYKGLPTELDIDPEDDDIDEV